MALPNFSEEKKLWRKGFKLVAGVDEVGRGAWAGPVVAAAVVFSPKLKTDNWKLETRQVRIDDSKKLRPRQRERAAEFIRTQALAWGIGEVPASVINRLGMAKASKMVFRAAVAAANRKTRIDFLLIDAFYIPFVRGLRRKHQKAVIRGDQKSISIAAASILAKVYRDKLMKSLSKESKFKSYKWGKNKGYGTKEQQKVIKRYGLTRLHRKDFVTV